MVTRRAWMASLAALVCALPAVASAKGKAKIDIVSVAWPDGESASKERQRQVKTAVRRLATQSAKHLDFGAQARVPITFTLKALTTVEEGDVVRVSCTLFGRIAGVGGARSKISFGGRPDKRKKVERQALASVTDGVMVRLAEMVRAESRAHDD